MDRVEFLKSSSRLAECPKPDRPEYAFIGRSNVGKSSLINMLSGRRALAKTSSRPGKTQLINHFTVDDQWYLVDLPGYGYAKVSKKERARWQGMLMEYLRRRENLMCLFVLVDGRIGPQDNDMEFMAKLGQHMIPFVIIFTKLEKEKNEERRENQEAFWKKFDEQWRARPPHFLTSSVSGEGKDELLSFIRETNERWSD